MGQKWGGKWVENGTPPVERKKSTLIKTEYWDRAGGGGNINYEW